MIMLAIPCALFALCAVIYGVACGINGLRALKRSNDALRIDEDAKRTAYRARATAALCDKREAVSEAWRKRAHALWRESKLAYCCASANAALVALMLRFAA